MLIINNSDVDLQICTTSLFLLPLSHKKITNMFTVIGIMFGGIALGYLLRKVELLQKIGKPISYTILLLLFLLGISVGANEAIVNNLATLGGQAFLLALAGTTGSVLAAWGVYHFFFKERRRG